MSAFGITGFVIGLVALLTSWVPIFNNFSAILAVIGLVFAILGTVKCFRKGARGKGLSIAGIILCVIAFIAVLITQMAYSAAIDEAVDELKSSYGSTSFSSASSSSASSSSASSSSQSSSADSSAAQQNLSDLSLGSPVVLNNGMEVTVNSVQGGLTETYSDSTYTCVNVTYKNNGTQANPFNPLDWSGEDAQGARRNRAYYTDGEEEFTYGELAPGGTMTGNVYFEGPIAKVVYQPSFWSNDEATWLVPA